MKKLIGLMMLAGTLAFSAATVSANPVLADRHGSRGVKCESCHKEGGTKAPKTQDCQSCHGNYEKLAKRTDKNDINPHDSHVENPACTDCHSGHKKPKLLCDQCHEFTKIKVP